MGLRQFCERQRGWSVRYGLDAEIVVCGHADAASGCARDVLKFARGLEVAHLR